MNRSRLATTLTLLAMIPSLGAWTWEPNCPGGGRPHWKDEQITLRLSGVSFPPNHPSSSAMDDTFKRWNATPSQMLYVSIWNDWVIGFDNDESEVWFTGATLPSSAWTYTSWDLATCEMKEADILFNIVDNDFTESRKKQDLKMYAGSQIPFRTVAIHELGHAQGLQHVVNEYSVMGTDITHVHTNGSIVNAYPGADAVSGSLAVYGLQAGAKQELGVSHWQWAGGSVYGYSVHERTGIFNPVTGNEFSRYTSGGEPVYRVRRGNLVSWVLTYENMGASALVNAKVNYYLSTNSTISNFDTLLKSETHTLSRGAHPIATELTIPTNLTRGKTYYLGAVIDPDHKVSEYYDTENATYTAIRVRY